MKRKICLVAALLLALTACSGKVHEEKVTIFAMDTVMELRVLGDGAEALREAETEIFRLDKLFHRGGPDSDVYKINNSAEAEVSADTAELVNRALEISRSTGGAFDIGLAPVTDLWGFYDKNYNVPSDDELAEALSRVRGGSVTIEGSCVVAENGAQLDLGGIAKGYAAQRVMDIFKEHGLAGIVSLGGNVQTLGLRADGEKWRVALQSPDDSSYLGYLRLSDMAAVTSGGYQRYFEENGIVYHHIIDPETGRPAESGLKSVTVVSGDGTLADGLSTALFVMGLEEGTDYWRNNSGFDVIFVTDDNMIYITESLADSFESELEYEVIMR